MDDINEKRFGYLRVLTEEEKIQMIKDLEEDIAFEESIVNNKNASSEQISEAYADLSNDKSKRDYLVSILGEKHLY